MVFGVLISLALAKVAAIATVATVTMRKRALKNREKEQKAKIAPKTVKKPTKTGKKRAASIT